MHNPFKAKSAEDIKKDREQREEINQRLQYLSVLGQKCLTHPDFVKYKEELVKQKDEIVKLMIKTVNPDPIHDAYFLRACLNKLSTYFELLELPNDDAGRRPISGTTQTTS
jgi:hypothetical protein